MLYHVGMTGDIPQVIFPSPRDFIANYDPSTPVTFVNRDDQRKRLTMPLGSALAFEELSCTGTPANRQDPIKRVQFLAGILSAADELRAEDQQFLPPAVE